MVLTTRFEFLWLFSRIPRFCVKPYQKGSSLVSSRCSVTPLPGLLGKSRTLLLRTALTPHHKIDFSAVTIFPHNHCCANSPDCELSSSLVREPFPHGRPPNVTKLRG